MGNASSGYTAAPREDALNGKLPSYVSASSRNSWDAYASQSLAKNACSKIIDYLEAAGFFDNPAEVQSVVTQLITTLNNIKTTLIHQPGAATSTNASNSAVNILLDAIQALGEAEAYDSFPALPEGAGTPLSQEAFEQVTKFLGKSQEPQKDVWTVFKNLRRQSVLTSTHLEIIMTQQNPTATAKILDTLSRGTIGDTLEPDLLSRVLQSEAAIKALSSEEAQKNPLSHVPRILGELKKEEARKVRVADLLSTLIPATQKLARQLATSYLNTEAALPLREGDTLEFFIARTAGETTHTNFYETRVWKGIREQWHDTLHAELEAKGERLTPSDLVHPCMTAAEQEVPGIVATFLKTAPELFENKKAVPTFARAAATAYLRNLQDPQSPSDYPRFTHRIQEPVEDVAQHVWAGVKTLYDKAGIDPAITNLLTEDALPAVREAVEEFQQAADSPEVRESIEASKGYQEYCKQALVGKNASSFFTTRPTPEEIQLAATAAPK